MGQNLDAKNYTYFDTERVSYTTYGPNSTKPSKEAPNAKESFSPSLLIARPEPPSPRLRVRPSAPPALGFEPFAFGPRPSPYPLDRRLAALRRPASGSLPDDLPNSATVTPAGAGRKPLVVPVPALQHQCEGGRHRLLFAPFNSTWL